MRAIAVTLALAAPSPLFAWDECAEYWFTRNLIFDRAGYCFASPLGQAVFGVGDCAPGEPVLDAVTAAVVAEIRFREEQAGCAVDSAATTLDVTFPDSRRALIDIPVPSEYESGCMGWRGKAITLRSGRSPDAPVTGEIRPGEDILFTYDGVDGWVFVLSPRGDADMGWFPEPAWTEASCTFFAG